MTEHRIFVTMRPGDPVWVSDEELLDLTRMGVYAGPAPFTLDDVPPPLPTLPPEEETDGEEADHGEQEA